MGLTQFFIDLRTDNRQRNCYWQDIGEDRGEDGGRGRTWQLSPFLSGNKLKTLSEQSVSTPPAPEELPEEHTHTDRFRSRAGLLTRIIDQVSLITLYLSLANSIDARWNLQRGFLGSIPMALFRVSKAASDFFRACCTYRHRDTDKHTVWAEPQPDRRWEDRTVWTDVPLRCDRATLSSEGWCSEPSWNGFLQSWTFPVCSKSFPVRT